jgi:hypothetical protein
VRDEERDIGRRADALEEEADRLEDASENVGGEIAEARSDWERKKGDPQAPGAWEESEEDDESEGEGEGELRDQGRSRLGVDEPEDDGDEDGGGGGDSSGD